MSRGMSALAAFALSKVNDSHPLYECDRRHGRCLLCEREPVHCSPVRAVASLLFGRDGGVRRQGGLRGGRVGRGRASGTARGAIDGGGGRATVESAENADAGWVDGSVSVERNPSPAPMCLCLQMRTHYATPRTIQPSHSGGSATAKFRARMRRGAQRLEPKVEAALGLAGSSPSSASAMAAEAEAARGAVGEEALRRLDVLDDGRRRVVARRRHGRGRGRGRRDRRVLRRVRAVRESNRCRWARARRRTRRSRRVSRAARRAHAALCVRRGHARRARARHRAARAEWVGRARSARSMLLGLVCLAN
jgi:hypothetical protein